jgi:hypothetical protein
MFDVSLKLLCTRKPGTLSRVIREINLSGLRYKKSTRLNSPVSAITFYPLSSVIKSEILNCKFCEVVALGSDLIQVA